MILLSAIQSVLPMEMFVAWMSAAIKHVSAKLTRNGSSINSQSFSVIDPLTAEMCIYYGPRRQ